MTKPVIECRGLSHVYPGNVKALENINLVVRESEILGVIGQNGSGKTTLVKHFNGLLKPTSGRVFVNGVDSLQARPGELAHHAGYVFQNPNHQLFANTVEKELRYGPENIGMAPEQVEERIRAAAELFNLQDFLRDNPYQLSFPLRKMVGIASIYTMKTKIVILDEPTTGQDNIRVKMVTGLIQRMRDEGQTVVVVSHDMMLIAETCTRIIALWNSKIIGDGTPREIFSHTELLEKTHLAPPQIFRLAAGLGVKYKNGTPLSIDEAVTAVE